MTLFLSWQITTNVGILQQFIERQSCVESESAAGMGILTQE